MTDGHFVALYDDGHSPLPTRVAKHFLQKLSVGLHIAVVHLVTLLGVILTGRPRVGSAILAVNDHDFLCHRQPPPCSRDCATAKILAHYGRDARQRM